MKSANIRVELDDKSEPLGPGSAMPKCRKIPYMLILGGKEEQAGTISVRARGGQDHGQLPLEKFITNINKETASRMLE